MTGINLRLVIGVFMVAILTLNYFGVSSSSSSENYGMHSTRGTIYVGPGHTYTIIQDAIDSAISGDVIHIENGTYYENLTIPNGKWIVLQGSGPKSTIIDGGYIGDTIRIDSDNNTVRDLKVMNSGNSVENAGIHVTSNNNVIVNCKISHNNMGISLKSASYNNISNCNISGNAYTHPGTENLVAHWKMNEMNWNGKNDEIWDFSGNGNHGKALKGLSTVTGGKDGRAAGFDGWDDYIEIPNKAPFDLVDEFTFSLWVYKNHLTDSNTNPIVQKTNDGGMLAHQYALFLYSTGAAGAFITDGASINLVQSSVLPAQKWVNICFVVSQSHLVMYIDGNEVSNATRTVDPSSNNFPLRFGWNPNFESSYSLDGKLDEVYVFNDSLSSEEVRSLYLYDRVNAVNISGSDSNTVIDNTIEDNGGHGVDLDNSDGNKLINNIIGNNFMSGIYATHSTSDRMIRNTMHDHLEWGITLTDTSSSNTLLQNTFLHNNPGSCQALDDGTSNTWNTPAGGNLWSDWHSPDNDMIPGIVDLPYQIDGASGASDQMPLCLNIISPVNTSVYSGVPYSESFVMEHACAPGGLHFETNAFWLTCHPDGTIDGIPSGTESIYWVNCSVTDTISEAFRNVTITNGNLTLEITSVAIDPTSVLRGNSVVARLRSVDHTGTYTQSELEPVLQHRVVGTGPWDSNYVSSRLYDGGNDRWDVTIGFPTDSEVGSYELRVRCKNPLEQASVWIYPDITISVLNNLPQSPTIKFQSDDIHMQEPIVCMIDEPGTDIETGEASLFYQYRWYLSGDLVRNVTSGSQDTFALPHTMKGDLVECSVSTFDGLNYSTDVTISLTVKNSPPTSLSSAIYLTYIEDLYANPIDLDNYFTDVDGDLLNYSCICSSNFTVDFDPFGMIRFTPVLNFNGNESALVSANDGEASCSIPVWLNFLPVNDPPILDHIQNIRMSQGDEVSIIIHGSDPFDGGSVHYGCDISHSLHGVTVTDFSFDNVTGELWIGATNEMVGEWNITAWVEDEGGLRDTGNFNVTILNVNDPPDSVKITSPGDAAVFSTNDTITFEALCTDGDIQYGQDITYTWRSNKTGTIGINSSFRLQYLPPGQHTITVEAFDGEFTVSDSITIEITDESIPSRDGTDGGGLFPALENISGWVFVLLLLLLLVVALLVFIFIIARKVIKKERGEEDGSDEDVLEPEISHKDLFDGNTRGVVSKAHRTIDIDVDHDTSISKLGNDAEVQSSPPETSVPPEPPHAVGDPDRMIGTPMSLPPSSGTVVGDVSEGPSMGVPPMNVDVSEDREGGPELDTVTDGGNEPVIDTVTDGGNEPVIDTVTEDGGDEPVIEPPSESSPVVVTHEGSSSMWTPDMAQGRTIVEKKLAMEQLKELALLHKEGVLSDEEFYQKKKELLRKI